MNFEGYYNIKDSMAELAKNEEAFCHCLPGRKAGYQL